METIQCPKCQTQINIQDFFLNQENEKLLELQKESEKKELYIKELLIQMQAQKKLTEEMQRKQAQISTQIQGEAQELAIAQWLKKHFPMDSIADIKNGTRGADCLQIINANNKIQCASIYYESKRTKEFSYEWIDKLKADVSAASASIGVIITQAMPSNMKTMGLLQGVWICPYYEFKVLAIVLRESLIQIEINKGKNQNRGEKMNMLYDYFTGPNFKHHIESISEGFTQLQIDLQNEKRAMQKIWKQREKQIEKVLLNTIDLYGSIKGIAGTSIPQIKALELDEINDCLDNL